MSPESLDILKATIGSIATVLVAVIGAIGVVFAARKPSKDKPPTGNTGKALREFNGTQNEFMSLVIADNEDLRKRQDQMDRRIIAQAAEIAEVRRHSETILDAVKRYLMKIATAWVGPNAMPWPDDEDFHILETTLPHNRRSDPTRKDR